MLPVLAGVACIWLMLNLTTLTWLRFLVWVAVGAVIYFGWSYRHSQLGRGVGAAADDEAGAPPSALFLALLTGGYIPLKPEGVRISYYVIPSQEGPLFGFDVQNHYISGFDSGLWGSLFAG